MRRAPSPADGIRSRCRYVAVVLYVTVDVDTAFGEVDVDALI